MTKNTNKRTYMTHSFIDVQMYFILSINLTELIVEYFVSLLYIVYCIYLLPVTGCASSHIAYNKTTLLPL